MAIRSAIAIYNTADASFDFIYCHSDGNPDQQLAVLSTKYSNAKKTRKLIAPGDMSKLDTINGWNKRIQPAGPRYYIDRGETSVDPRNENEEGLIQFAVNCFCEFIYIYFPRLGWTCHFTGLLAPNNNPLTDSLL